MTALPKMRCGIGGCEIDATHVVGDPRSLGMFLCPKHARAHARVDDAPPALRLLIHLKLRPVVRRDLVAVGAVLNWQRSVGDFVETHCQKWWITPIYGGMTRPESYRLRHFRDGAWREVSSGSTQRECKEEASRLAAKQARSS